MNIKKLGITRLSKEEKLELKAELKKTYLYAKAEYDRFFRDILNGKDDELTRENLEIEKEIMKESLLKIEKLKKL